MSIVTQQSEQGVKRSVYCLKCDQPVDSYSIEKSHDGVTYVHAECHGRVQSRAISEAQLAQARCPEMFFRFFPIEATQ